MKRNQANSICLVNYNKMFKNKISIENSAISLICCGVLIAVSTRRGTTFSLGEFEINSWYL